jgi:RND family efflux transporter MFP subunit
MIRLPTETIRHALAGAALALPLALSACSEEAAAGAGGGFVFRIPVTWSPLAQAEVVETVELVGDVYSRRWAELAFERAGRVTAVNVDIGDEVHEGAELARLDDSVLIQELAVARALAEAARANLDFAEREAARGEKVGVDLINASDIDRRTSAAAAARANHARSLAEIERIGAVLAQGVLLAPFDAVVSSRNVTLGSYATAGRAGALGSAPFTLVDMVNREVRLELPPSVATGLKVGAPVTLRADELPGLALETQLHELVPAADLASRTFVGVVRLDGLDPGRRLMPGMFVRATFERTRVQGQMVVPTDALMVGGGGYSIVVMDDPAGGVGEDGMPPAPTARIVPVNVLAHDREQAAIAPLQPGALAPDAKIVVTGADNAFPGAPLAPVAQSTLGPSGAGVGTAGGGDAP